MNEWRQKWKSLHPDWEVKIWSEHPEQPTILTCQNETLNSSFPNLLKNCCHLSQRSNIWRYELLFQLGGLYLDTDFEPIKCIEPLIDGLEAFAGWCHVSNPPSIQIGCAMIGCRPHNNWLRDLIKNMTTRDPRISLSLGSRYFTEHTSKHPEVHLFEPEVFYSQQWEQPGHYKPAIPDSAYAVHRWSSKWFANGFKQLKTDRTASQIEQSVKSQ